MEGVYIVIVSLKTSGNNNGHYCLFIPFRISSGIEIEGIETEGSCRIEILGYDCILKNMLSNLYSLTICQFKTKEEACYFLPKAFSFLYWLSLKQQIGLILPQYIHVESLPQPIDGTNIKLLLNQLRLEIKKNINPSNTIRVQDGTKIGSFSYMEATATLIKDLKKSEESFDFTSPEKVIAQENLTLAIELYSNYHYENTDNARFITLVTVLEALLPDYEVPEVALNAIDILKKSMKEIRNEYSREKNQEWKDLEHLLSRVGNLKHESIRYRMRAYISGQIEINSELGDPDEISTKLDEIYGNRSTLLHEGKIELSELKENLEFLKDFIPKLLKILYVSSVNQ